MVTFLTFFVTTAFFFSFFTPFLWAGFLAATFFGFSGPGFFSSFALQIALIMSAFLSPLFKAILSSFASVLSSAIVSSSRVFLSLSLQIFLTFLQPLPSKCLFWSSPAFSCQPPK
jgi:hypothetical protein